jgi:hypothetical protein
MSETLSFIDRKLPPQTRRTRAESWMVPAPSLQRRDRETARDASMMWRRSADACRNPDAPLGDPRRGSRCRREQSNREAQRPAVG